MTAKFCPRIPIFVLFLCVLTFLGVARAETIRLFHAEIRLQKDTSFTVRETIDMDFEGAQRRGIFRKIPVVYNRNGGRYSIYLDLQSVTQDGRPAQYVVSRQGRELSIRIGNPEITISGVHRYEISYRVRRAINFFNDAPELYWNVTGNEWPFAIQSASARVYPPAGTRISDVKSVAYFGPLGSTNRASVQVEERTNSLLFFARGLPPSDGLTLVAGFPAGSVVKPSALQQFLWFFADWWALFLLPLFSLGAMVWFYKANGRDVEGGLPAQVEWHPPKDLTPAEVGTLVDERCDMADIISTLIDLAARGYITIHETSSDKFLFFQNTDYAFVRTTKHADENRLKRHETQFLRGLFGSTAPGAGTVTLSSLKNRFYVHLEPMKTQIYSSLTSQHLFLTNPETERQKFVGLGVVIIIAAVLGGVLLNSWVNNIAYWLGLGIAGIFPILFAKAMPAKTATGSRKLRECVGFQRFVQLAEKDRLEKLITDDPTIFGRLLPYAMVLGVADEWANKFSDLIQTPPDWFVPYGGYSDGFHTHYFVNHLGHGMNSMGQTFASKPAPQSSAGSGSSGFGGGGFSGGGFGGGGGGSW